jgi:16S rRNA (guanine527-N7)-methyltransferase
MNREALAQEAGALGLKLNERRLDQFSRYEQLLLEWNARLNLTAITDPEDIRRRHFLDSLACATIMGNPAGQRLIDVGSGAGFPGLPLKILFPELEVVLVDSVAKKARFLEAVTADLGLTGLAVLVERAEVLGQQKDHRGRYDWAVARAVAELRVLVEYLLPLCRLGGHGVALKGEGAAEEAQAAASAIHLLGGEVARLIPVQLPLVEKRHYLVVVEKSGATPAEYPRRPGMAAKRPLT